VVLGVVGHAQQRPAPSGATQQPGVRFKTDVNLVEIHAVVTDVISRCSRTANLKRLSLLTGRLAFREVPFEVSNAAPRSTN
jgi:hypothetical protein